MRFTPPFSTTFPTTQRNNSCILYPWSREFKKEICALKLNNAALVRSATRASTNCGLRKGCIMMFLSSDSTGAIPSASHAVDDEVELVIYYLFWQRRRCEMYIKSAASNGTPALFAASSRIPTCAKGLSLNVCDTQYGCEYSPATPHTFSYP